jgi:precorrin-3B synthase
MTTPVIKGYCPGALRPMISGDGWVIRIRPFMGRLDPAQVAGIAALADQYGNGKIDISSRANLQIRGVTEQGYPALMSELGTLGLLDADTVTEGRRNILVTPFWKTGAPTEALCAALTEALASADIPDLHGKFGFAVDTGETPVLTTASADIRFERDADGGLLLAAEGSELAKPVQPRDAVKEALSLARWFAERRQGHKRMAGLLETGLALPEGFTHPRQRQMYNPAPALIPEGVLVGIAFGQLSAKTLAQLAALGGLRLTPWRMMLIEGAQEMPDIEGLVTDPADPRLRVIACTGAPDCLQGRAETRPVARVLAADLSPGQMIHISGCAKGCAHPGAARRTIVATDTGFDLIAHGRASDPPMARFTSLHDLKEAL